MGTRVSFKDQTVAALVNGSAIMLAQAPFVNALNRISVVEQQSGCFTFEAIKKIYTGTINVQEKPNRSLWNFQRGMSGHLLKETPRLFFKPLGAAYLKPTLDESWPDNPGKASVVFAAAMAFAEMAINPADTARVRLQSEQSLRTLYPHPLRQLYAGSLGNGMRQFGIWSIYSYSGSYIDRVLSKYSTLDPKSFSGMLPKSFIQATLFTSVVFPFFEYPKTCLQIDPKIRSYRKIFHNFMEGTARPYHGLIPKILGNTILTYGFNWLVENRLK